MPRINPTHAPPATGERNSTFSTGHHDTVCKSFAARMANHASTRTTQLYDRRAEEVTLDEVERVLI